MELNESQANELRVKFAEYIVDTMDMKCLLQFAFDSIIENLPINAEDLISEICDNYDQETLDDLLSAID